MTIDTLGYVKRLEAAGIDRKHAEAHAEAMRDDLAPQLASKQDLKDAVTELRAEIGQVRTDMWKVALAVVLATASLTTFLQRVF